MRMQWWWCALVALVVCMGHAHSVAVMQPAPSLHVFAQPPSPPPSRVHRRYPQWQEPLFLHMSEHIHRAKFTQQDGDTPAGAEAPAATPGVSRAGFAAPVVPIEPSQPLPPGYLHLLDYMKATHHVHTRASDREDLLAGQIAELESRFDALVAQTNNHLERLKGEYEAKTAQLQALITELKHTREQYDQAHDRASARLTALREQHKTLSAEQEDDAALASLQGYQVLAQQVLDATRHSLQSLDSRIQEAEEHHDQEIPQDYSRYETELRHDFRLQSRDIKQELDLLNEWMEITKRVRGEAWTFLQRMAAWKVRKKHLPGPPPVHKWGQDLVKAGVPVEDMEPTFSLENESASSPPPSASATSDAEPEQN